MATRKISALTTTTTVASDDLVQVVDVDDTAFGSSGTNKKITVANLGPELVAEAASTDLSDTPASLGTAGQVLAVNSGATALEFVDQASGSGTVTSVDVTAGTGISSSGGPITTSGSITVGISAGGVDTTELAADAVTNAKVAVDAIGTTEIQDEAITTDKLADDAVNGDKLNAALADLSNVSSTTPTNEQVLTYNSTSSLWEPRTSSGGGGSTTVYSIKTFAFYDSSIRDVYIPMSSESETTSIQRYNRYVCGFDGQVDTITWVGTTNISGGSGGSWVVRKITSGTNTPVTLETETFSSVTAYTTSTVTFSSSAAFSAGDVLVFQLTNGFTTAYGNVTGSIKFKFT